MANSISPVPTTHSSAENTLPIVTDHAAERWVERVCAVYAEVAPWDLPHAFVEAVPVDIPHNRGRGRLYSPTGSVLVFHTEPTGFPVLVTVLHAERMTLNDDHLKRCPECGLRFDPSDGSCSWHTN